MKYYLILAGSLFVFSASAQKMPDLGLNKVRITGADKTIVLETNPVGSDPDFYPNRIYYWYSSNAVHTTQGGFSGKLLNGSYTEYFLNKNLKEQGAFKKGLKTAIWKKWDDSGVLLEVMTWHEGLRSGRYSLFDAQGQLIQSGKYHNDLLDGEVKSFHGKDSVSITRYKAGKLVTSQGKSSKSFWAKLNIFKGHKDSTKPAKAAPVSTKGKTKS